MRDSSNRNEIRDAMGPLISTNATSSIRPDRKALHLALERLKSNMTSVAQTASEISRTITEAVGSSVVLAELVPSWTEVASFLESHLQHDYVDARAFCAENKNILHAQTISVFEILPSSLIKGIVVAGEFRPKSSARTGNAVYTIAFVVALSEGEYALMIPSGDADS